MKQMRAKKSATLANIASLITGRYPVAWSIKELELATGASRRTAERAVAELLEAGFIEKHYGAYRLSTRLVTQIYGAEWYVRQETERNLCLKTKSCK